jgi:hypothetical protein
VAGELLQNVAAMGDSLGITAIINQRFYLFEVVVQRNVGHILTSSEASNACGLQLSARMDHAIAGPVGTLAIMQTDG